MESLFEIENQNIIDSIKNNLKEYDYIDKYYIDNFRSKQATFWNIYNKLSKLPKYQEYVDKLYEELKKYFKELTITIVNFKVYGIEKRSENITIYQPGSSSPAYCLEMIPKSFFEGVKNETSSWKRKITV